MTHLIERIREELRESSSEEFKVSGRRFFKEEVRLYGVRTPVVNSMAKKHMRAIESLPKTELFSLCEELWRSGMMEECFIACNWVYANRDRYDAGDFSVMERWVGAYVDNWATCDTFCNHSVGFMVESYPSLIDRLKVWTGSTNRWVRRASAVSLIVPAKKGLFKDEVFRIADILMMDEDDMVRKGYGWLLKVTCEKHQDEVFDYVMMHRDVMPRTSLRYAIEKMPKDMRAKAMIRPGK